jgi:repressor LexA
MFWQNFVRLCEEKGIKPTPAAAEMGFPSASVVKWKRGTIPRGTTLQKIADYFSVSVDDLLSDTPPAPSKLHREEGEKIAVLASVGAGIPLEAIVTFDQDDPDSWEEISQLDASRGEYFALRIRGNSMEPEIHHGDVVIVRCAEEFADGDMVIALVNGNEGVCKILKYRDDGISLVSLNPEYPPMVFNREQIENLPVRLIGIVEEIRRRVRR